MSRCLAIVNKLVGADMSRPWDFRWRNSPHMLCEHSASGIGRARMASLGRRNTSKMSPTSRKRISKLGYPRWKCETHCKQSSAVVSCRPWHGMERQNKSQGSLVNCCATVFQTQSHAGEFVFRSKMSDFSSSCLLHIGTPNRDAWPN